MEYMQHKLASGLTVGLRGRSYDEWDAYEKERLSSLEQTGHMFMDGQTAQAETKSGRLPRLPRKAPCPVGGGLVRGSRHAVFAGCGGNRTGVRGPGKRGSRTKKLIRWWRWATDTRRAGLCAACRKRHEKRNDPLQCRGCGQEAPQILAVNVPIARLMLACETQWRVGFGGAYGLDYNAVFAVAGALHIPLDATVLRGLQALEREQLRVWTKDADKSRDE